MVVLWISTRPLENYQDQQADGPYQGINTQVLTTISKTKYDTIQKLVKYYKFMINQLGQPMQWQCSMILIIVFVVITESAKIKVTVKW